MDNSVVRSIITIASTDNAAPGETVTPTSKVDRRGFFRLVGAASLPLVAQGCGSDDSEGLSEFDQLRAGVNPSVELPIQVWRARKSQPIVPKDEHLSIDNDLTQYLSLGDQCRVIRDDGSLALYTVGDIRNEKDSSRVRMGMAARCRLGTTDTFDGTLQTTVVAEGLSDAEAADQSELVERLVDDGVHTGMIVLAPHGGFIERYVDEQAELMQSLLAAKSVSSWICKGYKQGGGAFNRWHITSTDLSRNSFPGLDQIADRGFAYALSFHGTSHELVVVGGGAPDELKQQVGDAISDVLAGSGIEVSIARSEDIYPGDSPDNIVNWLTAGGLGGIQIEQSLRAREVYGDAIAQAVAEVFDLLI